jgi:arylsulfatase A
MSEIIRLMIVFGCTTLALWNTVVAQNSPRPNVVFILADDLGWGEVGCFGQQKIPTPNLDSLARQGSRLTSHYSGAPVCAPSRCVLMTGQHTGHCLIRGNQQAKIKFPEFDEGQHPIADETVTLAEAFKTAGYVTGAMGKWGLGPVGSTGDPNRQGFDLFVGYNCQAVAHSFYPRYLWRNDKRFEVNPQPIPPRQKQPDGEVLMETYIGQTYAPSVMIDEAEKFLETNRDRPFFLFLPFTEPHVAMHPPAASVDRFPKDWDAEPYRGESGYLPHPRPRAAYAAMISDLDGYVGRITQKLKNLGLEENTIVIFTSDNGTTHAGNGGTQFHVGGCDAKFFNSNADLRGYKGSVYEGGIRVPTIVRYPNHVPSGIANDTPGYFADWFVTLAAATGIKSPPDSDGEDLWPAILGHRVEPRAKPMVWVFPEYGGQVAVRIGDFKVLRRNLKQANRNSAWEVYNIVADRQESNDLANDRADLIDAAEKILSEQKSPNEIFPVDLPKEAAK